MKTLATLILLTLSISATALGGPLAQVKAEGVSFAMPARHTSTQNSGPALLIAGLTTVGLTLFEGRANYYTINGATNTPTGSYPYSGTRSYLPFMQQTPRQVLFFAGCSMILVGITITLR